VLGDNSVLQSNSTCYILSTNKGWPRFRPKGE
jgi:hypothetical protein